MLAAHRRKLVLFENLQGRIALRLCVDLELRLDQIMCLQVHRPPATPHIPVQSDLRSPAGANQARVSFLLPPACGLQPLLTGCITYQSPERISRQTATAHLR